MRYSSSFRSNTAENLHGQPASISSSTSSSLAFIAISSIVVVFIPLRLHREDQRLLVILFSVVLQLLLLRIRRLRRLRPQLLFVTSASTTSTRLLCLRLLRLRLLLRLLLLCLLHLPPAFLCLLPLLLPCCSLWLLLYLSAATCFQRRLCFLQPDFFAAFDSYKHCRTSSLRYLAFFPHLYYCYQPLPSLLLLPGTTCFAFFRCHLATFFCHKHCRCLLLL